MQSSAVERRVAVTSTPPNSRGVRSTWSEEMAGRSGPIRLLTSSSMKLVALLAMA
jgi:hypothetical protein